MLGEPSSSVERLSELLEAAGERLGIATECDAGSSGALSLDRWDRNP
jgi:hypothetical protein